MSSPPDTYYYTAKRISIQKFANPACRPNTTVDECATWARDLANHMTRIMATTPPYDHDMPPRSPQTNAQVDTTWPYFLVTDAQVGASNKKAPRSVARNGVCHVRQRSASFPPHVKSTPTGNTTQLAPKQRDVEWTLKGRMKQGGQTEPRKEAPENKKGMSITGTLPGGLGILTSKIEALKKEQDAREEREMETPEEQQDKMTQAKGQEILDAIASNNAKAKQRMQAKKQEAIEAAVEAKPRPKAEPTASPKQETKPEPTDITSFKHLPFPKSNPIAKPIAWANDFCRKRRPSEIFNKTFNFTTPSRRRTHTPPISPRTSMSPGFDSDPSTTPTPADPWKRQKRIDTSSSPSDSGSRSPTAPNFISTSTDAHPGRPVTFSSPYTPPSDTDPDCETYHTYLDATRRRSSGSSISMHSPTSPKTPNSTLHTYTMAPIASLSLTPSPSATTFLAHVRASQEARKAAKTPRNFPGLYVDGEVGWGGGEPL